MGAVIGAVTGTFSVGGMTLVSTSLIFENTSMLSALEQFLFLLVFALVMYLPILVFENKISISKLRFPLLFTDNR